MPSTAVDFADPDFTFQRSGWGTSTGKLSHDLADIASGVRTQNATITAGQNGATVDRSMEKTTDAHQKLDAQSDLLGHAAMAFTEMSKAADDYDRDAPPLAEVQVAEKEMQRARQRMMETQRSADQKTYNDARKKLTDLRAKRTAAKNAQQEADKRIGTKLKALIPRSPAVRDHAGDSYGDSDPNAPSRRNGGAASPSTHPSAAPGGKMATEPSLHSPSAKASDAADKLMNKPQGQPVTMPPQQQQPGGSPTGGAPTPTAPTKGGDPFRNDPYKDRDKDRPSHLPSGTQPAAGGRPGMMPMGGMGGAPGAGGQKKSEPVVQSEETARMNGINAMRDAVRGGTILRRDGESGAS